MRIDATASHRSLIAVTTALLCAALLLCGCAATREAVPAAGSGGTETAAGAKSPSMKAELPKEIEVPLRLSPGDTWKSRFVSTSETKRTLVLADGKDAVKSRTVGLELVAVQRVTAVEGTVARVEVTETETRILQEGKFIPAPYKQFNPPNPVSFTIDTATGKTDFTGMRREYGKWMEEVKQGPAGDILGKTFRLPGYLAVLEEMYGKPFTRVFGRKLTREGIPTGKEVVLPFLGPGAVPAPVAVEGILRYTGFEAKGRQHLLDVSGKYEGQPDFSSGEGLAFRLADFGKEAPKAYTATGSASGHFQSLVDMMSGREVRSTGQLSYSAKWIFDGGSLTEEVAGKAILEPVE
jgi:hypothetical protein